MAEILDTSTQPLVEWIGSTRVTLAIVFTDIVGSVALGVELADEKMNEVRLAHFAHSKALLARHAGREIKTIGDSVLAVFRSVGAALDYAYGLHLDPGPEELRTKGVRAGVHIGSVDVVENDIFGTEVAVAARIVRAIEGAEIWISDQARRDITRAGARRHQNLEWQAHDNVELKGVGVVKLWSLVTATAPHGVSQTVPSALTGDGHSQHSSRPLASSIPSPVTISNIPIRVPEHFMGREDDLDAIETALGHDEDRVAITALYGLRGVGKTTLAATYAERHHSSYRATWWVRAQTESAMRADLTGLGVRLGWVPSGEKEEAAVITALERLRHEGKGILLIYDNAVDADSVKPYLPRGGAARVLVTSNAHAWRSIAEPVEIRLWPKEIGADYLIARTGRAAEHDAAEALSEALGGLPLAHEQAAAYCERLEVSLAEYCRRFEATPARLLDTERDAPAEYHDRLTTAKAFALAIDEAAKLHPAAEPLIIHVALLAPEPVPLFLFTEALEKFGEPLAALLADDGLDEAVAALRAFALVDREKIVDEYDPAIATDSIRLHRLVRQVAARRCQGEAREGVRRALVQALATVYPPEVDDDLKSWPRARRLDGLALAEVAGDTVPPMGAELQASHLMNELARYRQSALGAYASARPLFELAVAIRERAFGLEHPETAISLNHLARLLLDQGDLAAARLLCERALAIRERAFGLEHPETARSLNLLGRVLQAQGDLPAALPLLERALAIREKALGPEDPRTAVSLANLARVLQAGGSQAMARSLFERALAIHEKTIGPDHPDTASDLNSLADLLRTQGDLAGARLLYERALEIYEKALGPDHPDTVRAWGNLKAAT